MNARTLLRLYPRAWRARYGEELLALIGDRLGWRAAIDIGRAAVIERGDQLMGRNQSFDGPSSSVFYGVGGLAHEVGHELRERVPWRAAALWGIALGSTFVIDGSNALLNPTHSAFRAPWSDLTGVGICFFAGFVSAWRQRSFAHGGTVALVAIVLGFFVAIIGDVAAVLVISRFREFNLTDALYGAIEIPLPVMLMIGGALGTIGAAIAVGARRLAPHSRSSEPSA